MKGNGELSILRNIYIFKNKILIYNRHFGKALEKEIFEFVKKDIFLNAINTFQYDDYKKYRLSYITNPDLNLLFIFINTINDNPNFIKRELERCREEFSNLFPVTGGEEST